ncbi:hypothetical protein PTKIN_Ptkin11bG0104400 [Pterospermum kingtungense]
MIFVIMLKIWAAEHVDLTASKLQTRNCQEDAQKSKEDLYDLKELANIDCPTSDYEQFKPYNELNCRTSCLHDCMCAVAILRDDSCWKKEATDPTPSFPHLPMPDEEKKQDTLIITRSILFGTMQMDASGLRISIAVNKLDRMVRDGHKEFKTEINGIRQKHHKNLVRLLGICEEGEQRLLVYEFLSNGTLADSLFGNKMPSWNQRIQIALGIARGLLYLHEECTTQIIHCDIKPQNILLDGYYTA